MGQKQTRGTVNSTPCPWCHKPNDFRGVEDYGLEPGNVLSCDHCSKNFIIKRVQPVTMVWLAPYSGRGNLYKT